MPPSPFARIQTNEWVKQWPTFSSAVYLRALTESGAPTRSQVKATRCSARGLHLFEVHLCLVFETHAETESVRDDSTEVGTSLFIFLRN